MDGQRVSDCSVSEFHKGSFSHECVPLTHVCIDSQSGAGSCSPARSAVPSRSGTPTPSADADSTAADDATLRQLTAIVADVSLLERKVMEFFEQQIVAKISLARGSRLSSEGTESTNEQGKNTKEGEAIVGSLRGMSALYSKIRVSSF